MTPGVAALVYRCRIRAAADYVKFIDETDRNTLYRWAGDYKTGDIKTWARQRIDSILEDISHLLPLFADDESLLLSVQNAVRDSSKELERVGCRCGLVRMRSQHEHQ